MVFAFLSQRASAPRMTATPPPSRSRSIRRSVAPATPPYSSLLLALALALVAAAPPRTATASLGLPWKNAEAKLREQGLLHAEDEEDAPRDGDASLGSPGAAGDPAVGSDGGDLTRASPAEVPYREAKKILAAFADATDARGRRRAAKAFGRLTRALELDAEHRGALLLVGRAYQMGEGVELDEARAVEYFERAAALGDPGAHEELGFAYSIGWVRGSRRRVKTHTK